MKYTPPSHGKKTTHMDYFKQTHAYRRNFINTTTLSITNIVEEYPRFKDMPELVCF